MTITPELQYQQNLDNLASLETTVQKVERLERRHDFWRSARKYGFLAPLVAAGILMIPGIREGLSIDDVALSTVTSIGTMMLGFTGADELRRKTFNKRREVALEAVGIISILGTAMPSVVEKALQPDTSYNSMGSSIIKRPEDLEK